MMDNGVSEKTVKIEDADVTATDVLPDQLPALQSPSQARLRKFIYVGQAIAIAAVAAYGAVRPTGEREARVGYSETAQHIAALQAYVLANDKALLQIGQAIEQKTDAASAQCKAEVQSIRMYVTGYLMALSRTGRQPPAARAKMDKALTKLLERAVGQPTADDPPPALRRHSMPVPAQLQQAQMQQRPVAKRRPKLRKPSVSLEDAVRREERKVTAKTMSADRP